MCGRGCAQQTADENCSARLMAIISAAVDGMQDFCVHLSITDTCRALKPLLMCGGLWYKTLLVFSNK